MSRKLLREWTVDYGEGPRPCTVPHAWRQDVDVRWEGPAVYRTRVQVPDKRSWIVFFGVSYEAKGFVDDEVLGEHRGIWDRFSFDVSRFAGREVELRIEVVKNGGPTYPVKDVLSGFLPYVFNTFGGIYQDVEIVESDSDPLSPIASRLSPLSRVSVKGTKLFVDGKPFYLRAPLTWGWYPELGHTNPPEETIRREVRLAKQMGFNTMKFCLWVPPHRYFEILNEEGMFAWLELPLWDPTPDPEKQEAMFAEMERITPQYAHHDNIIVWTCGCELSSNTTAEFRERLYKMVKEITGCPLVKDNSGGSEMYGGDLREFGDFYDFHPYCDLPFYPQVLDSLLIGPRKKMPILLGEFNDVDVFRDLARLKKERPFWTSTDPYLNDQGVRWDKPELPRVLEESRFARNGEAVDSEARKEASLGKALFMRWRAVESTRAREEIAGYVITGWRDTPIASSGLCDDWNTRRGYYGPEPNRGGGELRPYEWNKLDLLFPLSFRRPPWVAGGNRAGWIDPFNHFLGPVSWQIAIHTEFGAEGRISWEVVWGQRANADLQRPGVVESGEGEFFDIEPCRSEIVSTIRWTPTVPNDYGIIVYGRCTATFWGFNVFDRPDFGSYAGWGVKDSKRILDGLPFRGGDSWVTSGHSIAASELDAGRKLILLLQGEVSVPAPFWREAAYQFDLPSHLSWLGDNWEAFLAVSPDRVIDLDALYALLPKKSEIKVLINRIDTRTYKEAPILVEVRCGKGRMLATTLRPYGGLGCQPYGVMNNPAGAALLESMMRYLEED